jgi:hypothetical protein
MENEPPVVVTLNGNAPLLIQEFRRVVGVELESDGLEAWNGPPNQKECSAGKDPSQVTERSFIGPIARVHVVRGPRRCSLYQ